jgi:hypothetical protein
MHVTLLPVPFVATLAGVSRKTRQRRRPKGEPRHPRSKAATVVVTEIERARLRERYAYLMYRSSEFGFRSAGLGGKAATRVELDASTADASLDATKGEPED